jgi:pyridoxamine 5'-phosphate oxidase
MVCGKNGLACSFPASGLAASLWFPTVNLARGVSPAYDLAMDLADFRKEYSDRGLKREEMKAEPVAQFGEWFAQATELGLHEPNAMTLATVDEAGMPYQRTVLLKYFDTGGFVFFTNYGSRKAKQMALNPRVSLLFPWITLERQVIVQGSVEKISTAESLKYFASRPRDSQIGAWVSNQSEVITSRKFLMQKLSEIQEKFSHGEIPLPSFWGGYRVVPQMVEFWQGGPARLHDRFLYRRGEGAWNIERLSP